MKDDLPAPVAPIRRIAYLAPSLARALSSKLVRDSNAHTQLASLLPLTRMHTLNSPGSLLLAPAVGWRRRTLPFLASFEEGLCDFSRSATLLLKIAVVEASRRLSWRSAVQPLAPMALLLLLEDNWEDHSHQRNKTRTSSSGN
jgi:hypothetical protein